MANDTTLGQVVLFGGTAQFGLQNDTWVWDGSNWALKAPTHKPPARWQFAMAYDAARHQVVLFGGAGDPSGRLNDTWVWDGNDWTLKSPAHSPSPRNGHALTYDAARGVVVLFGGVASINDIPGNQNDTWMWDGTDWLQRSPSHRPIARAGHAMAYDTARGQVVLFGGLISGSVTNLNDTWVWDGTDWKQQAPSAHPPSRFGHAMAYDGGRGRVVLFGGCASALNSPGAVFGDTWEWDGFSWTPESSASSPSARCTHAMAYARRESVLFGGSGLNDTWGWTSPQAVATPLIDTVVNGASFLAGVQNNSWITIRGSNLAQTSRLWDPQLDIVNDRLPTNLDGVSVTVNGKAAAVYYISPTQVNALAPTDSALGLVSVILTNANGTSPVFAAQMQIYSPGIFVFGPQSGKYAAATHADGTYLGPPGLFGAGLTTTPAKPLDVIVLYGTGFGMTNPPVPSDQVYSGAAPLTEAVTISIGGIAATVQFAGMSGPGLCQFNVVVPSLPDGDNKVVAIIGTIQTQDSVFITVRH
jgi:uncharacterized protein (TIGR03437 family)